MALNRIIPAQEYVDPATGEIKYIETILRERGEALSQWKPDPEKKHGRTPKHIMLKTNKRARKKLMSLTDLEFRTLIMMCLHAGWESNIVMGDATFGDKGVPMTWPDIEKLMCMDRRSRYKIQKNFEDRRIIGYAVVEGEPRGIIIHPDFVQFGCKIGEDYRAVFESKTTVVSGDDD